MNKHMLKDMIDVARGDKKASLVLKNCNVINVFTNEIIQGDIAIWNDKIVGIGKYFGEVEMDLTGTYIAPGFIDGHVHIESSMVSPSQFAKAVVPCGTTTVIADPHEIGNVKGLDGIKYILKDSENIPLDVQIMLPSCVPATSFENSGAVLKADDLKKLINEDRVLGLGELMNYPGVINGDDDVLDKILMAGDKLIDGHGPVIEGKKLNAYAVSGVRTDHECTTIKEMEDRLRVGMYILIREGSATKNLRTLIGEVNKNNINRCLFCTDDKHPEDILENGHIDNNIRLAVKEGIEPIDAIKMATINAAQCYKLKGKGAIAPGYIADLVVIDDLKSLNILKVFKKGKLVAEKGEPLFDVQPSDIHKVENTVNIKNFTMDKLEINLKSDKVNVIELLPHNVVTKKVKEKVNVVNGKFVSDGKDILKVAVIERHKGTGNVGLGLVKNFQLRNGAIASTIAHDSHNLIVIGDNDEDMAQAVEEIKRIGGGLTLVSEKKILKSLSLEIGGIMSKRPLKEVSKELKGMIEIAYEKLHVNRDLEPFMTLAFIALPVIPEIKVTDLGLFDVTNFKFIDISL